MWPVRPPSAPTPGSPTPPTTRSPTRPSPPRRVLYRRRHLVLDVLVDVEVVLAGPGPGVVGAHAGDGELAELARADGAQPEGAAERGFDGPVVGVVEDIPVALGPRVPGVVMVEHGVGHAAGGPDHGHGPVPHRDQGSQPARLEQAGCDQYVGAGVDEVGQFFLVADLEVAVGVVVEVALEVPEMGVDAVVVVGVPDEHELATV